MKTNYRYCASQPPSPQPKRSEGYVYSRLRCIERQWTYWDTWCIRYWDINRHRTGHTHDCNTRCHLPARKRIVLLPGIIYRWITEINVSLQQEWLSVRFAHIDGEVMNLVASVSQPSLHITDIIRHWWTLQRKKNVQSMRLDYCWPQTAINLYTTVRACRKWGQNKTSENLQRQLQLFLAAGALQLIAMEILGHFWTC